MPKPKGGRGKPSEYGSEMIRIPTPIKDRVIALKEMFYEDLLDSHDETLANNERLAKEYLNLISSSNTEDKKPISSLNTEDKKLVSNLDDALAVAREILAINAKRHRSVKEVIAKLISTLFNADIKPGDL